MLKVKYNEANILIIWDFFSNAERSLYKIGRRNPLYGGQKMEKRTKIDDVDVKILQALLRDARTNFVDIAKECNLSITAITQRYQKMKKNGTIKGTTLIIDSNSKNQHNLSVDIKAQSGTETSIIEAIKNLPRVRNCFKVIGNYDIHAAIRVESLEQIAEIKKSIEKEKGVLQIEITTSLDKLYSFPNNLSLTPPEDVENG
jgi:Lrp/AsnC family transcriptional regulator for asnA, asnC and gidA